MDITKVAENFIMCLNAGNRKIINNWDYQFDFYGSKFDCNLGGLLLVYQNVPELRSEVATVFNSVNTSQKILSEFANYPFSTAREIISAVALAGREPKVWNELAELAMVMPIKKMTIDEATYEDINLLADDKDLKRLYVYRVNGAELVYFMGERHLDRFKFGKSYEAPANEFIIRVRNIRDRKLPDWEDAQEIEKLLLTDERFASELLPLLRRDSRSSFYKTLFK